MLVFQEWYKCAWLAKHLNTHVSHYYCFLSNANILPVCVFDIYCNIFYVTIKVYPHASSTDQCVLEYNQCWIPVRATRHAKDFCLYQLMNTHPIHPTPLFSLDNTPAPACQNKEKYWCTWWVKLRHESNMVWISNNDQIWMALNQ